MQSPTWKVVFSSNDAGSYAWGSRRADQFLALKACIHLVVSSDSAVYMVLVSADARDLLVFDYGQFWFNASLRRWTEDVVTYHAGRRGLILMLDNTSDMGRFERACDQVLPTYKAGRVPPTLEQLGELGILPIPRQVGDFLRGDPDNEGGSSSPPSAPQEEGSVAHEDENSSDYVAATDLRRDMGELGALLEDADDTEDEDIFDEISYDELSAMEAADAS